MLNSFTELQPVLMSMLISMVFSFIIISPLSTVAIAMAIGLSGIAAGSASIGIAARSCPSYWYEPSESLRHSFINFLWWRKNDDA